MTETAEFDAASAQAALHTMTAGLASSLTEALGKKVEIEAEAPALLEDAELRGLLPAEALAVTAKSAGGATAFMLTLEKGGALDVDEGKALSDACGTVLASSIAKLSLQPLDRLSESTWQSGEDPLPGSAMVAAKISITVEGEAPAQGLWIVSSDLVETTESGGADSAATETQAAARTPDAAGLLIFGSKPAMAERVLASAGVGMRAMNDIAELVRSFGDAATGGVVVAVGAGDEHLLATVASLRNFPGCESKSIVIVLEEASIWNVVRCGRLGLFAVLGPEFSAEDFSRKLLDAQSS